MTLLRYLNQKEINNLQRKRGAHGISIWCGERRLLGLHEMQQEGENAIMIFEVQSCM